MKGIYKWAILAVVAGAVLSVLVVGCGRSSTVATINGHSITRDEYLTRLELTQLPGQQLDAGAATLQQMIEEQLILDLAASKGVSPTEEQVKQRMDDYARREKDQGKDLNKVLKDMGYTPELFKHIMTVQQAVFNLRTQGVKLDEKDVKDYYDQHKADSFTTPEQCNVAVIITKDKADADKAMDMLNKGVQFGTVARTLSIDKNTAQQDGRIPMAISKGQNGLPPILAKSEDAIFSTPQGHYTKPILIDKGIYAIYQIIQHTPSKVTDFKDVEYSIREQLMTQKGVERKNDLEGDLAKYRKDAKIDIDISRYKKLLLQNNSNSMPAAGPQQ